MKRLLRTVLGGFIFALWVGPASATESTRVRVGIEAAYPPFSAVSADGELAGFDVDVAKALCKEMGVECTLARQDRDGIIPALLARRYDAVIASMAIAGESRDKVAFTDPCRRTPAKFARARGSAVTINAWSMTGKTVAVHRVTPHAAFVTAVFGDSVVIRRYATEDEAYLDAAAGRVDLLFADAGAMAQGFLDTEQGAEWEFIGPDFTNPAYFGAGAGIATREEDEALKEAFNRALDAILRNGVYKEINDRYFDFNAYGEVLPM